MLADGSKLGMAMNAVVSPADVVDELVTDSSAPSAELAALDRLGVRVVIASSAGPQDPAPEAPGPSARERVTKRS